MSANHSKKQQQLDMTLETALEDLSSRFLLNVPEEEFENFERLLFLVEEFAVTEEDKITEKSIFVSNSSPPFSMAHWFYCDFYRVNYPHLPALNAKAFAAKIFEVCPPLQQFSSEENIATLMDRWMHYKTHVPVCGAIILNPAEDKILLVQGWGGSSWGFPRGKIAKDETKFQCAIREVEEEIGYDISPLAHEDQFIELELMEQVVRLFIVRGVSEDIEFVTQTRNEIRKIEWHYIDEAFAKKKYFMARPFIAKLRSVLKSSSLASSSSYSQLPPVAMPEIKPMSASEFLNSGSAGAPPPPKYKFPPQQPILANGNEPMTWQQQLLTGSSGAAAGGAGSAGGGGKKQKQPQQSQQQPVPVASSSSSSRHRDSTPPSLAVAQENGAPKAKTPKPAKKEKKSVEAVSSSPQIKVLSRKNNSDASVSPPPSSSALAPFALLSPQALQTPSVVVAAAAAPASSSSSASEVTPSSTEPMDASQTAKKKRPQKTAEKAPAAVAETPIVSAFSFDKESILKCFDF